MHFRAHDELAEVATALNHMCLQLKTSQEQLRHADRLKTVGSLASGIAHELGTPLNVVSGRANLIASGRLTPLEVADSVHIIKEQVQRMTLIMQQLLDFAGRKSPRRIAVDLRSLVQCTLDMLRPLAAQHQAELTLTADSTPVLARVDTGQMQQVVINLVTNAWQAMVDEINWQFQTAHWKPIHFLVAHHDAVTVHCFLHMASLCIVSSLHDGMNRVAKEFVAAQEDAEGVLILSEFAGAARELADALVINPYDTKGFADTIYAAITMDPRERRARMERMRRTVEERNVYRWAAHFLRELVATRACTADAETRAVAL